MKTRRWNRLLVESLREHQERFERECAAARKDRERREGLKGNQQ